MRGRSCSRQIHVVVAALLLVAGGTACRAEIRSTGPCSAECPIVSATLSVRFDPVHVGSEREYEVLRHDHGAVVRFTAWPRRVDGSSSDRFVPSEEWVPETDELERRVEEVDRFLEGLAAQEVCELEDPEARIGLHPTFVTLSVRDACENERTVKWVCEEPSRCPGAPYAATHERFDSFFEDR